MGSGEKIYAEFYLGLSIAVAAYGTVEYNYSWSRDWCRETCPTLSMHLG